MPSSGPHSCVCTREELPGRMRCLEPRHLSFKLCLMVSASCLSTSHLYRLQAAVRMLGYWRIARLAALAECATAWAHQPSWRYLQCLYPLGAVHWPNCLRTRRAVVYSTPCLAFGRTAPKDRVTIYCFRFSVFRSRLQLKFKSN